MREEVEIEADALLHQIDKVLLYMELYRLEKEFEKGRAMLVDFHHMIPFMTGDLWEKEDLIKTLKILNERTTDLIDYNLRVVEPQGSPFPWEFTQQFVHCLMHAQRLADTLEAKIKRLQ